MLTLEDVAELGPFDVIIADFPWYYYGDPNKMGAAGKHYSLMQDEDLAKLPIPDLMAKKSVLFLWVTSSTIARAIHLLDGWKLHYRGLAFDWIKTKSDGITPIGAQGVRPSVTKPLTEQVLVASHVAKGRPLPLADESICQTVFAPRQEHSRKPDTVQERIERMYPNAKRLEMFGRRQKPGWIVWGNDVNKFDVAS